MKNAVKNSGKALAVLWWVSLTVSVFAAPADWYKWRSKIETTEVCSQTSPGEGWDKASGPYKDAQCIKLKL
ncbi:hypothetical protein LPB67_08390 [Undibacterium sp. Jales W-56]|uniref:hypothetical protein n=1 Tax=Undibacterium sp. Jales W-56 TaxID=2897325 RepID=UPI0021CF01FA|nr:hypothetical protein [Undibacterium sp. Jales W-56]MCU6433794.1 hypothetical protein [Undibacterium sp. Jales W-56]